MKKAIIILILISVLIFTCIACLAKEPDTLSAEGSVVSISSKKIVILDDSSEKNETFNIDKNTKLINIKNIKEIEKGNSVVIKYVIKGKKKTAKSISVSKPSEEDSDNSSEDSDSDYSPDYDE